MDGTVNEGILFHKGQEKKGRSEKWNSTLSTDETFPRMLGTREHVHSLLRVNGKEKR